MDINTLFEEYDVYKYYYSIFERLLRREDISLEIIDSYSERFGEIKSVIISYRGYIITEFRIRYRRIILVSENFIEMSYTSVIQKKLLHEYLYHFQLEDHRSFNNDFELYSSNIFYFAQYFTSVTEKIDDGFIKFENLLSDEKLSVENTGHLRIGINSYFSFESLNELLEAYNKIYSLISFISKNNIVKIEENYMNDYEKKTLLVERINLASSGFLVAVGSGLIVEAVKELIKYVLSGKAKYQDYEEYKRELSKQIENDNYIKERRYVRELIDILDDCYSKLKRCNNEVSNYINNEIDLIVRKIEELQGIPKFDMLI